jgi:hypothetical protein
MKLSELKERYEDELIYELAKGASGVGPSKAGAIVENFDSLKEFLEAKPEDFSQIKNRKDNRIISDEQIKSIMDVKKIIPPALEVRQAWLFKLSYDFIHSQVSMVSALNLDNIDINPLLMEALDLTEPKDIISFVIYQSVTRSVVTSWGMCVEKMVKYVGCEDNDSRDKSLTGKNFDLKKCSGSEEYYIQVKSGPNTMNVGMVHSLNETIAKIKAKGKKALLGMTYGRRDRISAQIMGNLEDPENQTKIGRELWDFIAEEDDYFKKVMNVVSEATSGLLDKNFIELIDERIDELVIQWEEKFKGKQFSEILEFYI